ncbi:hypothetical protein MTR_4g021610 [Medicago truncatula]|uniref:Uncharacterized protein n=1 Tax=Medicago truncatula TaxID=3880 RepID=G7JUG3_MEDTR|nr:hypothetical protein MTR_4g021610 [Medicago truncatula]
MSGWLGILECAPFKVLGSILSGANFGGHIYTEHMWMGNLGSMYEDNHGKMGRNFLGYGWWRVPLH